MLLQTQGANVSLPHRVLFPQKLCSFSLPPCLFYPFIHPSIHPYTHPSTHAFIHPSVHGHLGCFHLLLVVNHIIINTHLQLFVRAHVFHSFGVSTEEWNSQAHGNSVFRLLRLPYALLFFVFSSSTNFLTSDGYITMGSSAFHTDAFISHSCAHISLRNTVANSPINRQV